MQYQNQRPTAYREDQRDQRGTVDPKVELDRLLSIEKKAEDCSELIARGSRKLHESMQLAGAIDELREMFTPAIIGKIRAMVNRPWGFRCDRGPGSRKPDDPYSDDDLIDAFIGALLSDARTGAPPTEPEFCILSGKCYHTRPWFIRKLADFPKLTNLEIIPEVPIVRPGGGMVVAFKCSWKVDGAAHTLNQSIPVRVSDGQSIDATMGKADRKIRAAIYSRLTGSVWASEGDIDDPAPSDADRDTGRQVAQKVEDRLLANGVRDGLANPASDTDARRDDLARHQTNTPPGVTPAGPPAGGSGLPWPSADAPRSKGSANLEPPAGWLPGQDEAPPKRRTGPEPQTSGRFRGGASSVPID